jgi:hypothetical protein
VTAAPSKEKYQPTQPRERPARQSDKPVVGLLADAPDVVRDQVSASQSLADFLRVAGSLSLDDRRRLVDQALVLLGDNYVHLTMKSAMHAVNPVQRLRLLRDRLERQRTVGEVPEWRFHAEMSAIFHSLRDLHTNYLLPQPFSSKVAFLPFLVEEYHAADGSHYVVSRVVQGFSAPGFGPGVELTSWSGMSVDRAVELNADRFAGSNDAARHARGVESLTVRSLRSHLPPVEQWVVVGYRGTDGADHELRQDWLVADNLPPFADVDALSPAAANSGVDIGGDEIGRAKTLLFAPEVAGYGLSGHQDQFAGAGADLPTGMPQVFRARSVTTASGTFGHLRIFTFSVNDPDAFVAEFTRLVDQLPDNGLILDVRGNGGGHIFASEFTLQTLTPHPIVPEPVQFAATPLNRRICRQHNGNPTGQIDLTPWVASLDQATEIGAAFSASFPISPQDGANAIGQRYHGPVVLVTDARCYSATDIFAAGFQDHRIGPVLGVDPNTGAGGANVWTHALLKQLLEIPAVDPQSPFKDLPGGANMRVAIRRTLRVGGLAGTPVEDLGVVPDELHPMTRDDVLSGNKDLLDHAGALLAALPVRRLDVRSATIAGGTVTLTLQVAGVDRIDVYVNGRPRSTFDVVDGPVTATIEGGAGDGIRIEGFAAGELVAACRHQVR